MDTNNINTARICIPVSVSCIAQIDDVLFELSKASFDMIELRADTLNTTDYLAVITNIKQRFEVPIIFTLRSTEQGGQYVYEPNKYQDALKSVIDSGSIDIIDLEYILEPKTLEQLVEYSHQHDTKVIISHHVMDHTPSIQDMEHIVKCMSKYGADICKLAIMAQDAKDVFNLLQVSHTIKATLNLDLIMIAMGDIGKISRVCTHLFGSCITFAKNPSYSAPGQIDSHQLRELMNVLDYY